MKIRSFIVLFILILIMFFINGCLWTTCQIADTVGKNNLSYSAYGAYTGYLNEEDKITADSLAEIDDFLVGGSINYGIMNELDLQIGILGPNFGAGLKYSPDFNIPLRVAVTGGLYSNIANQLVTPSAGLILSYHLSDNITFTAGSEFFIRDIKDYTGDIYVSIDLERNDLFKELILSNIMNFFVPKAIQFNVSYPFKEQYKKLHLGISLRYELRFSSDKPKIEQI